jgi:hypothetical protein
VLDVPAGCSGADGDDDDGPQIGSGCPCRGLVQVHLCPPDRGPQEIVQFEQEHLGTIQNRFQALRFRPLTCCFLQLIVCRVALFPSCSRPVYQGIPDLIGRLQVDAAADRGTEG